MVQSILIAGGGSAGWISANVLNAMLNAPGRPPVAITLVESPDIPTIGVGEATVPSIRHTLQVIGLGEADFMRASEATFKTLIRFENWNGGDRYDHPFDRRLRPDSDPAVGAWLADAGAAPFDRSFSVLSNLADHFLAPKAAGWPEYGSVFPYAYHLDAVRFAMRLAEFGRGRGVSHIQANITEVRLDETGGIGGLITDRGEALEADLYVDCTGFAARLIGQALGVGKTGYGDKLLCDRAATMRVPYEVHRPERLPAFTKAAARNAGWQWDIHLRTRRGLGYVYSSAFLSEEEAEAELRAAEGPHAADLPVHHIRFETAKRKQSWAGNCVAIGLSDGFLEPLESTGLYMIEFAAKSLAELIPSAGGGADTVSRVFNQRMDALFGELLEFVNLHYVTSSRRDTAFWRAATQAEAVADSVRDRLELWRSKRPSDLDFPSALRLFSLESYEYLLFGMGVNQRTTGSGLALPPDMADKVAKCLGKLARHEDWLAQLG